MRGWTTFGARARLGVLVLGSLVLLATSVSAGIEENLVLSAQTSYEEGLQQLDPDLYWESVNTLIQLFTDYPDSELARANHLTAVEICLTKIGDARAIQAAEEILRGYLAEYPYADEIDTRRMHLKLVQTLLLYRHDPNLAAAELSTFFSAYLGHLEAAEEVDVRLLEASIERKQGNFGAARRAYGLADQQAGDASGLDVTSVPRRQFDHEMELCQELERGQRLIEGPHAFFGVEGVSAAQLAGVRDGLESAATELGLEFGFSLEWPLTVYVFPDERKIAQLTGQAGAWVGALDGDLYVTPRTPLHPLLVQVFGVTFGRRSPSQMPLFLAEGFPSAFMEDTAANREDAARIYKMFDGRLSIESLADEGEYRSLPSREALAASFARALIDDYGMTAFGRLYGGLEAIIIRGEIPQSSAEYEADPERFEDHVDLEAMGRAFRSVTGDSLDQAWRNFTAGLESEAQDILAEFEARGGELGSARVQNQSAEATLASWFEALQKGDVEALQELATVTFREELALLVASYEEAGILEEARLWSMAIPYSDLTYETTNRLDVGPGNVQFQVVMKRDGQPVRTSQILLFNPTGEGWQVANGL